MDYRQVFWVADSLRAIGEEMTAAQLLAEAICDERRTLYDRSNAYQEPGSFEKQIRHQTTFYPASRWSAYLFSALGDKQLLFIAAEELLSGPEAPLVSEGIRFLAQLVTEGVMDARRVLLDYVLEHPNDLDATIALGDVEKLRAFTVQTTNRDYQRQALSVAAKMLSGTWQQPRMICSEVERRHAAIRNRQDLDAAAFRNVPIG